MATSREIAIALFALGRYKESYCGLQAEVPMTDDRAVQQQWKQTQEASIVAAPMQVRWLVFGRAAVEEPWVYVKEIMQ